MTGTVGGFGLALAFCAAVLTALVWGRAALSIDRSATAARGGVAADAVPALGRVSAGVTLAGCALAVAALEWALISHDFSVSFVAENGSRSTPLYYTITSLWAAHDGSLLLWTAALAGYLCVVAWPGRAHRNAQDLALRSWAVCVTAGVTGFFSGLALFTSHVFDRVSPVPTDGPGPTPLLQDHPAMGVHPPLLYLGLTGLVLPFAFGVAGLITGRVGASWLAATGGYVKFAWTALTAGIVLGAWWSYSVLGWGGYWGWDPVENSSLMPWLVATALLHSTLVQRRRGALPVWNLSLAVSGFLLAALGVLLTRSGLVASVHSFADSGVGPVLLGFFAALVLGLAVLAVLRAGELGAPRPVGALLSRGTALMLNNVLLVALTVTVLLGTLLPVLVESLHGSQMSVGPPYYNRMAVPLGLLVLLLMGVATPMTWRRDDPSRLLRRLTPPLVLAAATTVLTRLLFPGSVAAVVAFGLAVFVVATVVDQTVVELRSLQLGSTTRVRAVARWVRRKRPVLAGRLVHVGVAVLLIGVAASGGYTASTQRTLRVDQSATFHGVRLRLVSVGRQRTARLMETQGRLLLTDHGGRADEIAPALRFYPAHEETVAEPVVLSTPTRDVYVTLLSVDQAGRRVTVRLAVNPMVAWIWAGGALMVLGSLGGVRRRRRTGAAASREAGGRHPDPASGEDVTVADDAQVLVR